MAKPTGFIDYPRRDVPHRPVDERIKDFNEVETLLDEQALVEQAARCMDCGVPFCHGAGCPLGNRIPEFNDCIYRGRWQEACDLLHETNNFPEITGRLCPALCEAACTLSINDEPVLIRHIECQIVERGFEEGWIVPRPPAKKTGKRVAVVGSGPAALAAAQQLARAGHDVTVFEKNHRPGGLLRYGIPDFKLDKRLLDRRLAQLEAEGVQFQNDVTVGEDISARYLDKMFNATFLAIGASVPRDLDVPGRELGGVHFALEYLMQQNRLNAGEDVPESDLIDAAGKAVVVIGGGDTGSDCVGTARRQGAKEVYQLEILPAPPETRPADQPWPTFPRLMKTTTSHEEGCQRRWSVRTTKLTGADGRVKELHGVEVTWSRDENGRMTMADVAGSEFTLPAELVLLAMGFVHAEHGGLVETMELDRDARGNLSVDDNYMTSRASVFAAGDATQGASLIVHAIAAGRIAAERIDAWLKEESPK